jgi:hypothetical protein
MSEFLKMDIFFFVTTIVVVVLGLLGIVAMVYIIRLLRILNDIADTVDEETSAIKEDLDAARAKVRRGGNGLLSLAWFAGKTGKRLLKKKRRSS